MLDLVPDPRRLADELLAQRPRHSRQRQEARVRDCGSAWRAPSDGKTLPSAVHARSLDRRRRSRRHPAAGSCSAYNKLVRLRNEAEQGFSGIDVQLKRRADLIPNLVETVQGLRRARARGLRARHRGARAGAGGARRRAGGQRRRAHDGRADRACSASPRPIRSCARRRTSSACRPSCSDTEDKIAAARRYYNTTVRRFNSLIQSVPTNIIARLGGFREREFFRIEDDGRARARRRQPVVSLQEQIRANRVRSAFVILGFALLIGVFGAGGRGSRSTRASASCSRRRHRLRPLLVLRRRPASSRASRTRTR